MQFEGEPGLRVVLSGDMQVTQLVDVPDVHFAAIDVILVESQQVHRTGHSLVTILVAVHHGPVIQQQFQQLGDGMNELDSLIPPQRSGLLDSVQQAAIPGEESRNAISQ